MAAAAPPRTAGVLTPRIVRELAHVSQVVVAARAGCAVSTVRVYELDPLAISITRRDALDRVYADLKRSLLE